MRSLARLRRNWRALLATVAALGGLALLWAVRAAPLQPAPFVRVDALSAFFSFALLAGIVLAALAWPGALGWRLPAGAALLLLAWSTTLTPVIAGMYLLLALLEVSRRTTDDRPTTNDQRPTTNDGRRSRDKGRSGGGNRWTVQRVWVVIRRGLMSAPSLVAAGAMLVGYGALAARGGLRYDARTAGAALDSFVFWFVLLAAAIPILLVGQPTQAENQEPRTENQGPESDERRVTDDEDQTRRTTHNTRRAVHETPDPFTRSPVHPLSEISQFAWLYPLARLYSLGPWNTGWAFATLLLGGGAALWLALAALTRPAYRRVLAPRCFLALALAGLGLGTGAGIAAGCYAVLAYLVLTIGQGSIDWRIETGDLAPQSPISNLQSLISNAHWLLSGAIPLTAPFVAAWMLVGASVAGGVALLAGAAWMVILLSGLTVALADAAVETDRRALLIAAVASVALGIGAPLIILLLIQPVIEQLQGGLTPYGDVNIWPWVGLATIDAGHTPVTTLPSIAVAAFMLVLCALVYLIARLRGIWAPAAAPSHVPPPGLKALLAGLRDEVPWLGALAPPPADEERGVDGQ